MKLNYDQNVLTLEGQPYTDEAGSMTIGKAIIMACAMPMPGDDQLDPIKKYKIGEIAVTVHKDLDLTADQLVIAKERIAKGFNSPVLVYQLHQILEGNAQ